MYHGSGIVDSIINKLPFELHIPGYQYCGPGTKLQKRLKRGDPGINELDKACKRHDIAYSINKDLSERHKADKVLQEAAWNRVISRNTKFGEKVAAWGVTNAMKLKRKLGMGLKKRLKQKPKHKQQKSKKNSTKNRYTFRKNVINKIQNDLKNLNHGDGITLKDGSRVALAAAKEAIKSVGGRRKICRPRIIPIPKSGGFLPLLGPIFAGLSALGALSGGAAGIAKAINQSKSAQKDLEEAQRHNKTMEAIALGKKGNGLYLKPYKKGLGLYLKPPKNI